MKDSPRVLLIDDNPDDRVLVLRELARELPAARVEEVAAAEEFARAVAAGGFGLVVTDYQLGWSDGLAVLRAVKARDPDCPVIMFTGSGTQEVAVEAMKAGLDDYILKSPKHLVRLRAAARLALERAEARRGAARVRGRLRSLLDRLDVGVFRARPDGTLLEGNAAFLRLLGVAALEAAPRLDLAALGASDHSRREIQLRRPDGEPIWVAVSVAPASDDDGQDLVEGLLEDITARKRAEEERDRLLAAEQGARREAEAASRSKDRFLAMLSHELRTPLTPVLATVTAMLDEPATPAEVRPTLDLIRRSVELEARLIDDLLDVTRAIHGKLHLDRASLDLHALVHQTVGICRSDLHGRRLRLVLELAAAHPIVAGDPARLQQVLWNLVKNAVKFTPAGGTLTIRSRNEGGPGPDERVVVEISDTGVGIEPEDLERIFDAFEQVAGEDGRRAGGLGLGLAISRSVVEAHGGRLTAASAGKGRGATFRMELGVQAAGTGAGPPPTAAAATMRRSCRILLVEDDPASLRVMTRLLEQRGHEVTGADSMAAALRLGRDGAFDLVISDIGLPDGTGLDLLGRLRATRPMPGIALTGFGMEEDIRRSRAAGFSAHLTKPVNFPALEATIQRVAAEGPTH